MSKLKPGACYKEGKILWEVLQFLRICTVLSSLSFPLPFIVSLGNFSLETKSQNDSYLSTSLIHFPPLN